MPTVSAVYTYPLKSSKAISHKHVIVEKTGFIHDRQWAIFDRDNKCLTGRDYPQLLDLTCRIDETSLEISMNHVVQVRIAHDAQDAVEALKIFSYEAFGHALSTEADAWFSDYLGTPCRILKSDQQEKRPVLTKHGGDPTTDILGFADQAPVLIISEATLVDLNSRLEHIIGIDRFRPNIAVSGCVAYEEDTWKRIKINDVVYKIIQQCERCVFTTIDPISKIKDPRSEPLRTMATYRKGPKGGVVLGMHAVPIAPGFIKQHATIEILS